MIWVWGKDSCQVVCVCESVVIGFLVNRLSYIWRNKIAQTLYRLSLPIVLIMCIWSLYRFRITAYLFFRFRKCWMKWATQEYHWVSYQKLPKFSFFMLLTKCSLGTGGCGKPLEFSRNFLIWLILLKKGTQCSILYFLYFEWFDVLSLHVSCNWFCSL